MKYKHIFFDLDCTLWDFEANSSLTLNELFIKHKLGSKGLNKTIFIKSYQAINHQFWADYGKGLIDKETLRNDRFHKALKEHGIDDEELGNRIGKDYLVEAPKKKSLFPFTEEMLQYLSGKYSLHIITNGFEDTQHIKLDCSGIKKYFKEIITSDRANCKKPDPRIFNFAINAAGAKKEESLMIGDHPEIDMAGARNFGMDRVFFNPRKVTHDEDITFEISCLSELKGIL